MASRSDGNGTALVTGASGFTGRHVCDALRKVGYAVHRWTHEAEDPADSRVVDITDRKQVHDAVRELSPDYVVHLAAISFVGHGDVDAIYRVNVVGTRNLLEGLASLPGPPRKVLLASSANIYGSAGGVLDEATPPSPQNDYAISKLAMEYMARLWMDKLDITITRPFNYTGVGQSEKFLLPKIVSHFRRGAEVIELGNLDVWREFNDVRDVAGSYVRLLEADASGETFNICSGTEYSLREVVRRMGDIAGREIEVRVNPDFVRANEVERLRGDAGKVTALLGKTATHPLADTLRWMYESPGFPLELR